MMVEFNVLEKITDENKQLRARIEILETALGRYADPANWTAKENIARTDRGEAAREVLNGNNENILHI